MNVEKYRFGFIGFGHFAEVIYSFLVKARLLSASQTVFIRRDKDKQKAISQKYGIRATTLENLVKESDVIFLCVKPQNIAEVMAAFPKEFDPNLKFFISILAATPISYFQKHLGEKVKLMRAMPNLPSEIGEGMSALCFAKAVDGDFAHLGRGLFSSLGEVEEVSESSMDAVTALSGSGPAFAASLMDAAAKFGKEEGLSYEQSLRIVCQTFIGTARLILSGKKAQDIVKEISVSGGTTQAGIKLLQEKGLLAHFTEVLAASLKRAKEISDQI
jgi:pyrroline-5-carboxylate reductase